VAPLALDRKHRTHAHGLGPAVLRAPPLALEYSRINSGNGWNAGDRIAPSAPTALSSKRPVSDPTTKPNAPRRWTVLAAGFLVLALALVVIYTNRAAFLSPLTLVVVSAIGLAAVLLQIRLHRARASAIRAPLWLNVLGLLCAAAAFAADFMHLGQAALFSASLGAVLCFGISASVVFRALRRLPL
jgi:hypothetical protein